MGVTHVRALVAAVLLAASSVAAAHEIGTTQVRVAFLKNHTYQVDVITPPRSLLTKLELEEGSPRSTITEPQQLHAALQQRVAQLRDAAEVRFGNVRLTPSVAVLPIAPASGPVAITVRYSGDVPPRGGAFTWKYHLTYAAYALAIETPHAAPVRYWIQGDESSPPFPLHASLLPPTRMAVVQQYLVLGFTHIVPLGLDHILFVLGMFLLSSRLKSVLTQVTAFTLAHSITLALSIYGIVSVRPSIVEPLIALSIAYVAIENLTTRELKPWRVAIVFGFGLLHGLGFAGVLQELGLPRSEYVTALVAFNAGVEVGQLSVIAAAWLLVVSWAERRSWYRRRLLVPASLAIAAAGIFWTVQRLQA